MEFYHPWGKNWEYDERYLSYINCNIQVHNFITRIIVSMYKWLNSNIGPNVYICSFTLFFSLFILSFFYFIISTFTYMCIYYLGHLPPNPAPHTHILLGRTCSALFILWFCWRENIGDNKKNTTFLLVWDKDSYVERLLVLLPCTCVLQPTLVHLYLTSSLLSGHLPIVASASLRLFTPLQWAHQPHSRFRFPSLSLFFLCSFLT
jgi:hypothetical protein